MRKIILLLKVSVFVGFCASQDVTSTWPMGTYVPGVCVCAPKDQCAVGGIPLATDGEGILEARVMTNGSRPSGNLGIANITCQPVHTGVNLFTKSQESCDFNVGLERCCTTSGFTCGIRYPPVANSSNGGDGQAAYGAYPFQAVILTMLNAYLGSGVLIDQFTVITAAHKIVNRISPMKVRFGDWDAAEIYEVFPSIEINATAYIHPNFTANNLKNNIAIIRLASPAPLGQYPTISNICLPNMTISNATCWTSGWGKNGVGSSGRYQDIMKEVDVPLVDHATCQRMYRATVLGRSFRLDDKSFVCAGGVVGKDACTGDGGAPLSCFVGDRFYLVGLVAWGIGCGTENPGVYVNVQTFIPWIQKISKMLESGQTPTDVLPTAAPTLAGGPQATSTVSMTTIRGSANVTASNSTLRAGNATTTTIGAGNATTTTMRAGNATTTTMRAGNATTTTMRTTLKSGQTTLKRSANVSNKSTVKSAKTSTTRKTTTKTTRKPALLKATKATTTRKTKTTTKKIEEQSE